jgi:hypothetical protein
MPGGTDDKHKNLTQIVNLQTEIWTQDLQNT